MNPILFFFGYCKIEADAMSATRLLNLCLENGFSFSGFKGQDDGAISFYCPRLTAEKLLRLAEQRGICITVERFGGLPTVLFRRCRRYGLILGTICGVILIILSGRVVWDVRVEGNERLTAAEVKAELSACGFGVGSSLKNFKAGELENRVLLQSNDLSWISIHMDGTVAVVQVLEQTQRPENPSKKPANLIAARDGQIEGIELLRGDCVVKVGQAVRRGDLLVSGIYDGQSAGLRFTRAAGQIFARTERAYRIEIPLETTEKRYLQEKKGEIWLNFFQNTIKIFKSTGNRIGKYDIIIMERHLSVMGLKSLPVWITQESRRYYEEVSSIRSTEEALNLAYEALASELSAHSPNVQLLKKEIATTITDHSVILDCTVLGIENIAVQSEFEVELHS